MHVIVVHVNCYPTCGKCTKYDVSLLGRLWPAFIYLLDYDRTMWMPKVVFESTPDAPAILLDGVVMKRLKYSKHGKRIDLLNFLLMNLLNL